jgi:chromosome segregation ATPase
MYPTLHRTSFIRFAPLLPSLDSLLPKPKKVMQGTLKQAEQLKSERRQTQSLQGALEAMRTELADRKAAELAAKQAGQAHVVQLKDKLAGMDLRLRETECRLQEALSAAEIAQQVQSLPYNLSALQAYTVSACC